MRRRLLVVLAVCLSFVTLGCDFRLWVPAGSGPLRYRDQVFSTVDVTSGITYGSAVDQLGNTVTLQLDMYEPGGDDEAGRPAIVWVHGGAFYGGTRTSPELVDQANVFAKKGYVNVSISYRLAPSPGCLTITASCITAIVDAKHDAQAAVRFLRANADTYDIDPGRIAIAGTSAGAITALNVGYGPEDVGTSGNPGYPSTVRAAVSLSGARILTTPSPGEAPALLFHGTADSLVPYQWALDTVTAAEAADLHIELTTWQGAGHVPYIDHRTEILDQTSNFLYWMLDAAHAPQ